MVGNRLLLYSDNNRGTLYRIDHRPQLNIAIIKGVMTHVSTWPTHVFMTFITMCFMFTMFVIISAVTAIFHAENVTEFYSLSRTFEIEEYPNVYFVKHANKTWSREQLCGIESSAREYPDIQVYLINLLTHDTARDISRTLNVSIPLQHVNTEEEMRRALGMRYQNVRNIDIAMQAFFKNSILAKMYNQFDIQTLEAAARAQLVWRYPGVALDPIVADQLKELQHYICRRGKSCQPPRDAAINVEGSVQATGFPCHAFFGYFIKNLAASKFLIKRVNVIDVYQSFCTNQLKCPGIKILARKSEDKSMKISCPIIAGAFLYHPQ